MASTPPDTPPTKPAATAPTDPKPAGVGLFAGKTAWWARAMTALAVGGAVFWSVVWWEAWWPQSPAIALVGVALIAISGRFMLPLGGWAMVRVHRARGLPAISTRQALRIGWAESRLASVLYGWTLPWREHAVPDRLNAAAAATGGRGVVLVHGWLCHRGVWNAWLQALQARGVPCVAVTVPALWGPVESGRAEVDAAVRRITEATGCAPVVVAHSMGGLVVRDWLRSRTGQAEAPVHAVVTLGSPHAGTWMAQWGVGKCVAQMREGSDFLTALVRDEHDPGAWAPRVRWVCWWADGDAIVFPHTTSVLPWNGVESHVQRGQGHLGLLACQQALEQVVTLTKVSESV